MSELFFWLYAYGALTQPVPLTACLSVDNDLIIVTYEGRHEIEKIMHYRIPVVSGIADAFKWPTAWIFSSQGVLVADLPVPHRADLLQGYSRPCLDLLFCPLNLFRSQKVESAELIFLAIFVEQSPCTAMGHPWDGRKVFVIREIFSFENHDSSQRHDKEDR